MNKTALLLAADQLERAADEFSNHGCNDYMIDNTPENEQFIMALLRWNSDDPEEQEIHYSDDKKWIYTRDTSIMGYCAYLLKKEVE